MAYVVWPANETGWRLQVQNNPPAQGLGTNWVEVPGAAITNQISLPINNTNGSVFYRLIYPYPGTGATANRPGKIIT